MIPLEVSTGFSKEALLFGLSYLALGVSDITSKGSRRLQRSCFERYGNKW
ncbi:hypothetical protein SOHN41_03578 [Shewanella sp. HN-41]|nr:hypothetical protein SOHN41_03578 [Shewanella sp. HN-41]